MGYSDAILKSDHVGIMVQQWCSDFYIFGALMTKGSKTIRAIILTCFYWIRPADRSTVHHAALCGTLQSRRKCCRGAVRPCSGAFLIKCVKLVICQMLHRICRHLFTNTHTAAAAAAAHISRRLSSQLSTERERPVWPLLWSFQQ